MVFLNILGGVPVLSLLTLNPFSLKKLSKSLDDLSPDLPASKDLSPMCTTPPRNVPVVNTTVLEIILSFVSNSTPVTMPSEIKSLATIPSNVDKFF